MANPAPIPSLAFMYFDIWDNVFKQLEVKDVHNIGATCRIMRKFASHRVARTLNRQVNTFKSVRKLAMRRCAYNMKRFEATDDVNARLRHVIDNALVGWCDRMLKEAPTGHLIAQPSDGTVSTDCHKGVAKSSYD